MITMESEKILERLEKLYSEGESVLKTRYDPNTPEFVISGDDFVDETLFTKWQSKCSAFLEELLDSQNFRLKKFKETVESCEYRQTVKGMAILESLIEDIKDGNFTLKDKKINENPFYIIENIFNKFHRITRQLRIRHDNRNTLEINDEYDVQDLLHALLLINFEDVRPEEWTPSYAGGSSRMDFLIKDIDVVIETKMTRENLKDKKIGEELIIDIEKYSKHPNCNMLYCFVYDKGEFIKNPTMLENDLSSQRNGLEVKVIIIPKF